MSAQAESARWFVLRPVIGGHDGRGYARNSTSTAGLDHQPRTCHFHVMKFWRTLSELDAT